MKMIKERWLNQFDRLVDKDERPVYRVYITWLYDDAFGKLHSKEISTFYSFGINRKMI